jgi:hypothetical protein
MKKLWQTTIIFLLVLFHWSAVMMHAAECPVCRASDISELAMVCPECGSEMHDPALNYNSLEKSTLTVALYYTGKNPDRMPPYGKLYINGEYMGNIPMIEKELIVKDFSQTWSDGLGKKYSAYYEKHLDNIAAGILKVEVEMKFDRFYGLGRSFKRVVFPYVSFEEGARTRVNHYFNLAVTFSKYDPPPKKPLPVVSEMKIQGASGTVALNVPLFK